MALNYKLQNTKKQQAPVNDKTPTFSVSILISALQNALPVKILKLYQRCLLIFRNVLYLKICLDFFLNYWSKLFHQENTLR